MANPQIDLQNYQVVCLAGGVGGAKLAEGLAQIVPAAQLTIIVNTGDDFQHLGLQICPDLDTVIYRLAGIANDETGWGRAEESWRTISEVGRLGGPDWFRLGDLDLALHLTRSGALAAGERLTAVTRRICQNLAISPAVLPMCDEPAPTIIVSGETAYPFQTWFVQEKWQPPVTEIRLPAVVKASNPVVRACRTPIWCSSLRPTRL
jgi:LPPG:FO 2-phospho-L-lactate transferase